MALHWDVSKVKNNDDVCFYIDEDGDKCINLRTDSLIWMCMFIDMGGITEKNWKEFWQRIYIYEKLNGARHFGTETGKRVPKPYTADEIRAHIGLSVNVHKEGKVFFMKKMFKGATREADAAICKLEDSEAKTEAA